MRTSFTDIEWLGKPIDQLDHAELLQLCERLHDLLWLSSENVERVVTINNWLNAKLSGRQPERLQ